MPGLQAVTTISAAQFKVNRFYELWQVLNLNDQNNENDVLGDIRPSEMFVTASPNPNILGELKSSTCRSVL